MESLYDADTDKRRRRLEVLYYANMTLMAVWMIMLGVTWSYSGAHVELAVAFAVVIVYSKLAHIAYGWEWGRILAILYDIQARRILGETSGRQGGNA